MEGRYSSTRRRLASLSSDHFLWLKTESRGPESGRWIALGCQHMRSTHLCLWRICLCEGRTRIILFPGFRSCGSTWCDLIHRALIKAGFPDMKEPQGLLRSDGKRPDGIILIPWKVGRSLIWDATIVDTLAPSYLPAFATRAGAAAGIAEDRKIQKYRPP